MQKRRHITNRLPEREASHRHLLSHLHHFVRVALGQITQELNEHIAIHHAEHLAHALKRNGLVARKGNGLIKKAQAVSH